MRESYDFSVSIRTLKKELPETSQIGIGDDACLFNIKYNGIDDKFSKPIRLVGNVMVFCVKGSVHMSVNLNEYDVKEGCHSLSDILNGFDCCRPMDCRHKQTQR